MPSSTFERYGGFSAVSRVVMTFYELVLDSDEVGHHFDDIDMPRLIDHQTKFISSLMGGPSAMSDDRLKAVHQTVPITDADFDEIGKLLAEAMAKHGMSEGDISQVVASVESKRPLIVNRATA
ncbi:group 1 truncated hemoglobin [Tateyamaria sp. syn59]|uniref:group I truncated hemoglobin n=1 Tax=Tateyamaria sp. syn59 TaxID=2576942 RepID=UPI0011BF3C37|nr:group 1 truncated hemoglobin [Tateyamaria sp. syn59]